MSDDLPISEETRRRADVVADCGLCWLHLLDPPSLIDACASVGIERGVDGRRLLVEYLAYYHQNGHSQEPYR